jgi:hypothetical protein
MELIDTHHRTVVRGYIMDRQVFPELTPREALAPYLEGEGNGAAKASAPKKTGMTSGDGHAAAHRHSHSPKQIRQ